MPWLRVGDDAATHPVRMRVFGLGGIKLDDLDAWARANLVFGFVVGCASLSAGHLTDRFVSNGVAQSLGGPEWERWARDAVKAGYWTKHRIDGEPGYLIGDFEEFLHIRSREAVEFDRKRDSDRKNPALTMAVRQRDGDACRYCGQVVNWSDRKGARGGTYDHTDPDGPTTLDTYVVCCRACNSGSRMDPASYPLRDVPAVPYYHPKTLELLAAQSLPPRAGHPTATATARAAQAATAPPSRPAAADPATQRDPAPGGTTREAERSRPVVPTDPQAGRSGQPGSGRVGSEPTTRTRRRGRRGSGRSGGTR